MNLTISTSVGSTTVNNRRRQPRHSVSVASLKKTIDQWRGWVRWQVPFQVSPGQSPLELHSDWLGPLKLTETASDQSVVKQFELYIDDTRGGDADPSCDDELSQENKVLFGELADTVATLFKQSAVDHWRPPEATTLSRWLRECGHDAVIDQNQSLRFTIHREGLAGQVRVQRGDGSLRFVLPLGRWNELPVPARSAMERLAREANRRTRLARITFSTDERGTLSCEAQVDLTGLPWSADAGRCQTRFWQTMIRQTATGMMAAHHQLGLELAVLAEPANVGVTELFAQPDASALKLREQH